MAVLDWLTGNCWLFGLAGQNWMLVVSGGLLIYVVALGYVRRRQERPHRATRQPSA